MPDFEVQIVNIDGMHCDACVRRVTQALGGLPGVRLDSVTVGRASVLAQPECDDSIRASIEGAGFTVASIHSQTAPDEKG